MSNDKTWLLRVYRVRSHFRSSPELSLSAFCSTPSSLQGPSMAAFQAVTAAIAIALPPAVAAGWNGADGHVTVASTVDHVKVKDKMVVDGPRTNARRDPCMAHIHRCRSSGERCPNDSGIV